METMAIASAALIGKGLLAGAINDLYGFLKTSTHYERLEGVLRELDIKAELDVVQALLTDLSNHIECNAVRVASEQVKESVDIIHAEIRAIHDELEYHKTRYFNYWRTPAYDPNLNTLRRERDTLRKRRELLLSVLSVQGNIHRRRRGGAVPLPPIPPKKNNKKSFLERLLD